MITKVIFFGADIIREKQVRITTDDPEVGLWDTTVMAPLKEPKLHVLFEAEISEEFTPGTFVADKNGKVYLMRTTHRIELLRAQPMEYFEMPEGDFIAVASPYKE